jgi:GNAT superfamily N-acetyltransferase
MSDHLDISIREFEQSDLPAVKALVDRTIDVCYTGAYCPEAIQFFKDWHSDQKILNDASRGHIIVLEMNGRVVGTGTLVGDEIKRVFVEPSLQKRGLGRIIMRRLEDKAAAVGIGSVRLDASLPSKKFYDSLGYITLERTFLEVADGKRLDYYKMGKHLSHGCQGQ